jgi:hypothetical protein
MRALIAIALLLAACTGPTPTPTPTAIAGNAALQRVIGGSQLSDAELDAALDEVLRQAPEWMRRIESGAPVDDQMEILLDACHRTAFDAALRTRDLVRQNALDDLADACTAVRLDAISGPPKPASIAAVREAISRLAD